MMGLAPSHTFVAKMATYPDLAKETYRWALEDIFSSWMKITWR